MLQNNQLTLSRIKKTKLRKYHVEPAVVKEYNATLVISIKEPKE